MSPLLWNGEAASPFQGLTFSLSPTIEHSKILSKIKYMEVTEKPSNSRMLKANDQEIERVRELKYIGPTRTEDNRIITEIKQRNLMTNRASYCLKKQLNSRYSGRQTKCALYNMPVRHIITYGSKSWSLK